jgi:hypothetical protein
VELAVLQHQQSYDLCGNVLPHTVVTTHALQAQAFMLPQLKELLQKGTYQPAPGSVPLTLGSLEIAQAERTAKCRVILTAEQTVPYLDNLCTVIKVCVVSVHMQHTEGIFCLPGLD